MTGARSGSAFFAARAASVTQTEGVRGRGARGASDRGACTVPATTFRP